MTQAPPFTITVDINMPMLKNNGTSKRILNSEANKLVRRLIETGEQKVSARMRPRPRGVFLSVAEAGRRNASKGNLRRNLNSVVRGLRGRLDVDRVIYGPWIEGVGSRNQTTRFKGYFIFREVRQRLERDEKPKELKRFRRDVAMRLERGF